ncbi:MAG TPA: hypothetical protein PLK28_19600 [Candidatus Rifleibacterium sp.]|nr:hypothetical protein [Candidatus Rifleibacterium sp.]
MNRNLKIGHKSAFFALLALLLLPGLAGAGELLEKARRFDNLVAAEHIPRGLVVNLQPIEDGQQLRYRSAGDSTIWTGAYIAAQVYRYRVTSDTAALDNLEKALRAFVQLHEMADSTGFVGRALGTREELGNSPDIQPGVGSYSHLFFKADTSRDQYTGIFMGCALAWPLIRDEQLRRDLQKMIGAAAHNLKQNNLALKVQINGISPSTFDLNPDYAYQDRITPEEWAKVDDFPANVFAAAMPYSDRLARIVARFQPPPVRGGEALRALLMFQTACNITQDPELTAFFNEELLNRRQLHVTASETAQLLSDLYLGRNLPVVENRINGLFKAIGKVFVNILAMRAGIPDSLALWAEPVTILPVVCISQTATDKILNILDFFRQPGAFAVFNLLAEKLVGYAASLKMFKAERAARKLQKKAREIRGFATSNIDEFSDTMRSYVGCNLGFFALLGILDQPADPRLRQSALAILPRSFEPIADEANSMYTFITAAFSGHSVNTQLLKAARQTLQLYPEDQLSRRFDHSQTMRHSLWPDRFGRYGRQSIDLIPINQRAPHIFIWQEPPRMLITGSDDRTRIAPVGYLLAYWFGRHHGLLTKTD